MHVQCARYGHTKDDTYELDLPLAQAHPMEAHEPGKWPEFGAHIDIHVKRAHQVQ